MFNKILIANRGEIAVRIIECAHELGIKSVAIYSTVDKDSIHVLKATESYHLEGESATDTYLNIDKIIEAAKATKAEAIHPGYGFLSENYKFAKRCWDEGIVFIGPHPNAIKKMGDKIESKRLMQEAGIPVVPGFDPNGMKLTEEIVIRESKKIGFPVILKASAGGGGKGMRVVYEENRVWDAFQEAAREAQSSFGDDTVFIEKYVTEPRHIEFQVLGDNFGNVVHLYERECSIQRRHQKIIEETPSPALTPELREKMGESAVKAAKAINYNNAGTIEFILDKNKNFYFLEMNTRLQVEHPITEVVTGYDIVKKMIKISAGEPLPMKQEDIKQRGHAIECRLYAENPDHLEFRPSIGLLTAFNLEVAVGVRNDTGFKTGDRVSVHYDPLLAKLITYGEDRTDALNKMYWALTNYTVLGVDTNIEFLRDVINHKKFRDGMITTHFIPENFSHDWVNRSKRGIPLEVLIAAILHDKICSKEVTYDKSENKKVLTPWQMLGDWGRANLKRTTSIVENFVERSEDMIKKIDIPLRPPPRNPDLISD